MYLPRRRHHHNWHAFPVRRRRCSEVYCLSLWPWVHSISPDERVDQAVLLLRHRRFQHLKPVWFSRTFSFAENAGMSTAAGNFQLLFYFNPYGVGRGIWHLLFQIVNATFPLIFSAFHRIMSATSHQTVAAYGLGGRRGIPRRPIPSRPPPRTWAVDIDRAAIHPAARALAAMLHASSSMSGFFQRDPIQFQRAAFLR